MRTCPTCGNDYQSGEQFCPRDGSALATLPAEGDTALVGKVLDGKYRLEAPLSQGGMGSVYRATHLMLGKTVAVKVIRPELVASAEMARRFQREARAASHLEHPNIVAVHDLGETRDGTLYIAMELVEGPSLRQVIREEGPLEPARACRILADLLGALVLAHKKGIIHRDLKPHNVVLSRDAHGAELAKLLDFGIAKSLEIDAGTEVTGTGTAIGTPQYMAPEQATGKEVDGRTDLYALGVMLYEMLVGEVPFNDPSAPAVLVKHLTEPPVPPSVRRPDLNLPADLERLALRCLEKSPARRPGSAAEMLAEVTAVAERLRGGATLPHAATTPAAGRAARAASATERAPSPARGALVPRPSESVAPVPSLPQTLARRSWWVPFAALWLVALLAVTAFAVYQRRAPEPAPAATEAGDAGQDLAVAGPSGGQAPAELIPLDPSAAGQPDATTGQIRPAWPDPPPPGPRERGPRRPGPDEGAEPMRPGGGEGRSRCEPAGPGGPMGERGRPPLPAVYLSCEGPPAFCNLLRMGVSDELAERRLPLVAGPERADAILRFQLAVDEEPGERDGPKRLVRAFSVRATAELPATGERIDLPAPERVLVDSRDPRPRLMERAHAAGAVIAERLIARWQRPPPDRPEPAVAPPASPPR